MFVYVQVEEGGKADSLEQPLLVGDEIIIINDVELTGYRQEAVTLVKGSYKTLQLTVRRYRLCVCDCVCQCMCMTPFVLNLYKGLKLNSQLSDTIRGIWGLWDSKWQ